MAENRLGRSDHHDAPFSRLSVVISNYNYADFVGTAVESAMAVDWHDVEVVVVDDGSTDGSRAVLERYEEQVTLLLTENRGQVSAANTGFQASTGDVVVFLDSDDALPADLAERLSRRWTPTTSKAQFSMQRVDRSGLPLGDPFPRFRRVPSPAQVRHWMVSTTAYPTPPASGNAYARWYLDKIMPLTEDLGRYADSGCLAAAPVLGDVQAVPEVVVQYRQHGANDSNLLAAPGRFSREVERASARWRFACGHARSAREDLSPMTEDALRRSRELLQFRVAAARLEGRYALPGDNRARQLVDVLRSPLHPGPEDAKDRVLVMAWCLLTWAAPRPSARKLAELRWGRPAAPASAA